MAHFESPRLKRPNKFNFATDAIDYWAAKSPPLQAMYWIDQNGDDNRILSYKYFSRQSHRVSILLQNLGVKKGETMLVILPRVPEWWEIGVAAIRSGIILCPATTLLVDKDVEYRAQKLEASVFVGDKTSVAKLLNVRSQCPKIKTIIQIGGTPPKGVVNFHARLDDIPEDATFKGPDLRIEDPSLIYFTSGTSGPPKMVQHNQISYPLASTITGKHWIRLSPGKMFWNLSEQGWAKAAWSFFGTWNCGATLFVHDDRQAFKPLRLLEILHKYPVTNICAPPTVYRQLILDASKKFFKENPPMKLQHCVGAGEPLNDEVIKQWKGMSGVEICDGYGQTETILICGNFEGNEIRPGSMGKPSPGTPLAVIDTSGNEVKVDEEGDIALLIDEKGIDEDSFFGIYDGYIDDSWTAKRRTRSYPASGKGAPRTWYLTGDRGTMDKDGYIWFVGRADDVINSASYRIGPFEVESTLKQHPGVVESAVVASPDQARGEVVKAFVVLTDEYAKKDATPLIKELQDFCKERAAPYKYPRKIQFVDSTFLPKTISGKIKRNELKKSEFANGGGATSGKPKM